MRHHYEGPHPEAVMRGHVCLGTNADLKHESHYGMRKTCNLLSFYLTRKVLLFVAEADVQEVISSETGFFAPVPLTRSFLRQIRTGNAGTKADSAHVCCYQGWSLRPPLNQWSRSMRDGFPRPVRSASTVWQYTREERLRDGSCLCLRPQTNTSPACPLSPVLRIL